MIAGHRWKYNSLIAVYKCMPLPTGGVESHQWCVGCGCIVTMKELKESGFGAGEVWLDILASGKGCEPIEAGTLAEYKLHHRSLHPQSDL